MTEKILVPPDDTVWIAFHRDAFGLLGTRTEQGYKLTFALANERKWPNGLTTAELQITASDDGMTLQPKLVLPKIKRPK